MIKKTIKNCLIDATNRAIKSGYIDHVNVLTPIINKIKSIVLNENTPEMENNATKEYLDSIIEEKRNLISKLANKRKAKQLEKESTELATINFYYENCCR